MNPVFGDPSAVVQMSSEIASNYVGHSKAKRPQSASSSVRSIGQGVRVY